MSIDLNPDLYAYEPPPNVCPAVFGFGLTPDVLILNFNGILRGDLWVPADGEPPNGIWQIPPTGLCFFQAVIAGHSVTYSTGAIQTGVQIITPNPTIAFFALLLGPGLTWFANSQINPAIEHFYEGFCSVTSAITSDQANLQDLWNSLGEIRQAGTYVTPRSKTATETVHTISRRSDHTNIHILFDDS